MNGSCGIGSRLGIERYTFHTFMRAFLAFTLVSCVFSCRMAEAQTSQAADARMQQVETGLILSVLLKGRPVEHYSIGQRMEFYHVVGLSVAVIEHYEIAWSKGYGMTDKQSKRPVEADTLFQAGSISKPVAAVAAMKLVQDGKLDLDSDVNQRLKSWHVPENEFTKTEKVTLRRLLSHSAGLTVHGFPATRRASLSQPYSKCSMGPNRPTRRRFVWIPYPVPASATPEGATQPCSFS